MDLPADFVEKMEQEFTGEDFLLEALKTGNEGIISQTLDECRRFRVDPAEFIRVLQVKGEHQREALRRAEKAIRCEKLYDEWCRIIGLSK